MTVTQLIATHSNTDFDGFAAMVAAHKLFPEAAVCLGGAVNRNVREFHHLYADALPTVDPGLLDLSGVRRLILLDTVHPNRLGELGELCGREGVEVIAFDHHGGPERRPSFIREADYITSDDGSLVTLMLRIIAERRLPITVLEATLFALGIHEDTGSLSFSTTTLRDAEALAFCMRQGAEPALIERYLNSPLDAAQRQVLADALGSCVEMDVPGRSVLVTAVTAADYVEGVSVVAHALMDLTNADAVFLIVAMQERLFVVARSRSGGLDVGRVLEVVGGGGHAVAASVVLRDTDVAKVIAQLGEAVTKSAGAVPTAADVMSAKIPWVTLDAAVDEALILCRRQGVAGVLVVEGEIVVGSAARDDLERAAAHRLGHAPVKAVMSPRAATTLPSTPVDELTRQLTQAPLGWLPVVAAGSPDPPRLSDVVGAVSRAALVRTAVPLVPVPAGLNLGERLQDLGMDELFGHLQAVGVGYRGIYLVGGAVRDLLLHQRSIDIDVAVEGDGVEFAHALALRLKGKVRPHLKFQTAVVIVPGGAAEDRLRIDVASTRTEFYDFPAALPTVEYAGIRSDLARRDFSVNAMAISLSPENYGDLLDYFGGVADLEARRIRVLHNLSFIEDPTRILRAVRYESRYGLRMDDHTLALAHSCIEMDLVGDLSSARLRDELVLLLGEPKVDFALSRLAELDIGRSIHPRLATGAEVAARIDRADELWRRHCLPGEVPLWRLRLIWLLAALRAGEILEWAERMHFRREDGEVLARGLVVGQRLAGLVARGPTETELFDAASVAPLEAVLAAIVLGDGGAEEERLGRFLDESRHLRLEITGRDLLDLGLATSPEVGNVLRALLHLKVSGVISGRAEELEAARRLV